MFPPEFTARLRVMPAFDETLMRFNDKADEDQARRR